METKIILIIGSTGLLGSSLSPFLSEKEDVRVIRHGYKKTADINGDLCDLTFTERMLSKVKPDIIVNTTGLTNVDLCEANPQLAYLVNVKIIENLCQWLRSHQDTHLIHISTDQVYDGPGLHKEEDVSLKNFYAYSKYCSELAALPFSATVLRTNFFGKSKCANKESFSDWIFDSLTAGRKLKLFTDIYFSPVSLTTINKMILKVIKNPHPGVFNLGSKQGMSKRDFAHVLAEVFGLPTENCEDIRSSDMQLKAYRPENMCMDSRKFEQTFNVSLPALKEEIISLKGGA